MGQKINIHCQTCLKVHEVDRDNDAPKTAVSMWCKFCPSCEDRATDYYEEGYNESDNDDLEKPTEPDSPNQLVLPFIIEQIEHKTIELI